MMDQAISRQGAILALYALNIVEASANLARIIDALESSEFLTIDLSSCEDVDTAGLQLLAAIRLDPAFQSRVFWTGCSQDFQAKAMQLGLAGLLAQSV